MIELTDENTLYGENEKLEWKIMKLCKTTLYSVGLNYLFEFNTYESTVLYLYSLVTVDGVGVLVMGLLVTVHTVVGIAVIATAAAAA